LFCLRDADYDELEVYRRNPDGCCCGQPSCAQAKHKKQVHSSRDDAVGCCVGLVEGQIVIYSDARPLICSGDLIAQSTGSWLTWKGVKINFVRMFTRSTYSHVGIAWVVGGRVFMLEAVSPKLRIYPMSSIGDFYLIPLNANWSEAVEELALSKVGVNYSQATAVKSFFILLDADDVRQCAAYVLNILRSAGINLGTKAIPDDVVLKAMQAGATCVLVTQKELHE